MGLIYRRVTYSYSFRCLRLQPLTCYYCFYYMPIMFAGIFHYREHYHVDLFMWCPLSCGPLLFDNFHLITTILFNNFILHKSSVFSFVTLAASFLCCLLAKCKCKYPRTKQTQTTTHTRVAFLLERLIKLTILQ